MNAFIVCPSCAHGVSPVRRSSVYFKSLIGDAFQKKKIVYVGEGSNVTGMVSPTAVSSAYHINNVIFVFLIIIGPRRRSGYTLWSPRRAASSGRWAKA